MGVLYPTKKTYFILLLLVTAPHTPVAHSPPHPPHPTHAPMLAPACPEPPLFRSDRQPTGARGNAPQQSIPRAPERADRLNSVALPEVLPHGPVTPWLS